MGKVNNSPRKGSKQFWPRKRAKKLVARVRTFASSTDAKPLGFIGYKAGMTHMRVRDNNPHSLSKSQIISIPVTIIECPPLKPLSLRFYKKTIDGLHLLSEVFADNVIKTIKKGKSGKQPDDGAFTEVRLVVHTEPKKTGFGKKNHDIIEVAVGGKDLTEQLTKAQELLKKDSIAIAEVIDEGQLVDVHGVTKGKGTQGPVKRFGVRIRQHKSEKTKRGPGNLGAWTPKRVAAGQIAHAGKMGMHQRTEYNRLVMKIAKAEEVNQKGGIKQYGVVKNDTVLIKGSVAGAAKRPVIFTMPLRAKRKAASYEVLDINVDNKQ